MRRSFEVVLFYIMATAAANLLSAAIPAISIHASSREADAALQTAYGSFQPGGGLGETLFAALNSALTTVDFLFTAVGALPIMLTNVGVPTPIVVFVTAPLPLIILYDGIHIMTGRFA